MVSRLRHGQRVVPHRMITHHLSIFSPSRPTPSSLPVLSPGRHRGSPVMLLRPRLHHKSSSARSLKTSGNTKQWPPWQPSKHEETAGFYMCLYVFIGFYMLFIGFYWFFFTFLKILSHTTLLRRHWAGTWPSPPRSLKMPEKQSGLNRKSQSLRSTKASTPLAPLPPNGLAPKNI